MDVGQSLANFEGNMDGAIRGKLALFFENQAQWAAFHPLRDHVNAAGVVLRQDLHDAGMIELAAEVGFTVEAVKKEGIALEFRVRNLDGYRRTGAHVRRAQ